MNIAHIGFTVSNLLMTKEMYTKALAPLGITVQSEGNGYVSFGSKGAPFLWLGEAHEKHTIIAKDIHVAFSAQTKEEVDAFYQAGSDAGFKDNGAPGIRTEYAPNYYGAFLLDDDGNNIEAVTFL
jgi:catechol 2,3-dioxygenase-like lactoylglutathione lyase family enzyme